MPSSAWVGECQSPLVVIWALCEPSGSADQAVAAVIGSPPQGSLKRDFSFEREGDKQQPPPHEVPIERGGPTGNPLVDATIATIGRGLKRGNVSVKCPRGCSGKVSAYAVALAKQRGKAAPPRKRAKGSGTCVARA